VKKSRFFYLHPEANAGKIAALDSLQEEYAAYLKTCVQTMLSAHRFTVPIQQRRVFFPPCERLSSQIAKLVREHAIGIVSGWASSNYAVKLKQRIGSQLREKLIDEPTGIALYTIGKRSMNRPSERVSQEAIDLYWSWLLDEAVVGKIPTISNRCGMRMSEMTAVLAAPKAASMASWWLAFSHLNAGQSRIQLPLAGNPYVKNVNDVSKGILARKDRRGRWRFELVERREWEVPEATDDQPRIGVDVGINVVAATSDGRLLGRELKPKFNALYEKVRAHRANRQRQNIYSDSPRLSAMESRLTGMVKTMAGQCANSLVRAYPKHVFVIEDLNLRGCRGSKRFAFKALHHSLTTKAPTVAVNCAFTSQTCPSCGHFSRKNRNGIKFRCRACGRLSHADVVGAKGALGRSEDKRILLDDHYTHVGAILRERYVARRNLRLTDSSSGGPFTALAPSSRGLTEGCL
jgi:hypothetical protein